MPNYFIQAQTGHFNPMSFDDMVKPLNMYKQYYEQNEEKLTELQAQAKLWEDIANSELDAENFYSIYGKENIEAALNDLKKSDEEILNTYSVEAMRAAVADKLGHKTSKTKESAGNILKFPTASHGYICKGHYNSLRSPQYADLPLRPLLPAPSL